MLVTSAEILALPQVWESYALLEAMQYSIDFRPALALSKKTPPAYPVFTQLNDFGGPLSCVKGSICTCLHSLTTYLGATQTAIPFGWRLSRIWRQLGAASSSSPLQHRGNMSSSAKEAGGW